MEMHSHLSALNETRNDWFLRVRVTGIWNNTTSSGILIHYNMILLDCENNHMHAVVAPELWNLFAGIITPGTIYCIRNVNVSPTTALFRPVHSKDMIHFTAFTTFVLDLNNDLFIPRHKFHITPLNELRDSFYFYGPENQPVYSTGSIQISTLPASKIYINLDHDFVFAMRQRLREEGYVPSDKTTSSPTMTDVKEVVSVIETVTLKELSEKTSTDFLKMSFMCKVKVKSIEESDNWWYGRCNKNDCHEEVIKFEGKYRCARCQKNYPVPQKRFKIVVLAEDDTEAFNLVLYDRAVKRLLDKTVTNLMAEGYNDPASYPPPLKQIAGREITVKVELTDDNILVSSIVYYVVDAYECSISTSPVLEDIDTGTSVSNYINISIPSLSDGAGTPGSALSTSKRVKKEK
ncbi:uncharacterized protein LOC141696867 [Apium graveolens]|uniref:uncharacterized protein LOC141696867 n=1 Tax=Apium graveolens TaxID=4045 RepID=UPI003D79A846